MKQLALLCIRAYQRWLSPRKGFCCAYRAHTGGASCSGFGYAAIAKHGLLLGLRLLHRRFAKCAWQAQKGRAAAPVRRYASPQLAAQAGFCDGADCLAAGCDGIDCGAALPDLACNADAACCVGEFVGELIPDDCGGNGAAREDKRLARAAARRTAKTNDQGEEVAGDSDDD